jgi:hypothetical protein
MYWVRLVAARIGVGAIAAPAAISATIPTAAAATLFARTSFVDGDLAAIEVLLMQARDRGFALGGTAHGDKAKAARTARALIHHDFDIGDCAETLESVLEIILGGAEGKIPYVESHIELW